MTMYDNELQRFKTEINLSEFSASLGYALDKRASSRNSAVMRHANGDKIIVARSEGSGDWIYFSVRDDRDNGTIIDFLQNRSALNLGQVRKRLREWLGTARPSLQSNLFIQELLPLSRDRSIVLKAWEKAKDCLSLPYLTSRGIGPDVLALDRFAGCVRVDQCNNALFPHYDNEGLCGYEIKNKGFTGFAPGGMKGLWSSRIRENDNQLILVESAIDAFSYHILHGIDRTRYASTGGKLNPRQPGLIRDAVGKMSEDALILIAFDHDEGGEKIAEEVRAIVFQERKTKRVVPDVGTGKDWNEMLKYRLGLT
ncbi:MAG: DUF3991 and TOPRIM domain-containing protein [Methanothrix sp.]|jgi:hypothetical protein|nr:DUF3991 and TOPRIM domain-containing protein [Methanothrix sp.]